MNQPIRSYPLRLINEPAVFVIGEKTGQKVFPHGAPGPGPLPPQQMPPNAHPHPGMNFNPQAMLAQQNSTMEQLERRRERERERERVRDRSVSMNAVCFSLAPGDKMAYIAPLTQRQPPPRIEDDDSAGRLPSCLRILPLDGPFGRRNGAHLNTNPGDDSVQTKP